MICKAIDKLTSLDLGPYFVLVPWVQGSCGHQGKKPRSIGTVVISIWEEEGDRALGRLCGMGRLYALFQAVAKRSANRQAEFYPGAGPQSQGAPGDENRESASVEDTTTCQKQRLFIDFKGKTCALAVVLSGSGSG